MGMSIRQSTYIIRSKQYNTKRFAFMRTMTLRIDNYCPISDRPTMHMLEDYWASHLAKKT
ncbi:hypothetical protein PpBr36_04753 [Pyricularia pennisetigena]|uniref:hypothetical protein n=1 Tax=Pyricularia pennisetigena TaxID=1578925 RepID=UPI00115377E4|nr:hypothetical protein PpBr36_04753 [Pyricularia pennisetigena]TLS26405.1 hypothetical protein PpBr36_04753 [Pyricularia pennisetigena]